MAAEQLRALVEGAPFIVHTASAAVLQNLQLLLGSEHPAHDPMLCASRACFRCFFELYEFLLPDKLRDRDRTMWQATSKELAYVAQEGNG